jgi:hypothetical protein
MLDMNVSVVSLRGACVTRKHSLKSHGGGGMSLREVVYSTSNVLCIYSRRESLHLSVSLSESCVEVRPLIFSMSSPVLAI